MIAMNKLFSKIDEKLDLFWCVWVPSKWHLLQAKRYSRKADRLTSVHSKAGAQKRYEWFRLSEHHKIEFRNLVS